MFYLRAAEVAGSAEAEMEIREDGLMGFMDSGEEVQAK